MQENDLLLTIAKVSLAFAGLMGIAGLFGSQSRPDLFRTQFFLVVAIVGYALLGAHGLFGGRVSGFDTFAVFLQLAFSGCFFFQLVWSFRPEA